MTNSPTTDQPLRADADTHGLAGDAGEVRADRVEIVQGGAGTIEADSVSVQQGGAGRIVAREVSVSQGGIGLAKADRISLREGSSAFAVIADEATVSEGSNVFLLVSNRPAGEFRPVLDWRAVAAFGAALALVMAILRRAR